MRIALSTVGPWATTGYGVVTKRFIENLKADGHEVAVFATVGTTGGGVCMWEGIPVFPPLGQGGDGIIQAHVQNWKPDVVISFYDQWFSSNFSGEKFNWICWNPVDHDHLPETAGKHIRRATKVVAMSKHGQKAMQEAGIECEYIPLGISSNFRIDRDARHRFRKAMGIEDDVFLYGSVGANSFWPSRKGFDYLLQSFKTVHDKYPNTKLLLHTTKSAGTNPAYNLSDLVTLLGLTDSVIFTDEYSQYVGVQEEGLVEMYNAMDCFVLATVGEGFGLPVVEAQACGVPVIATNCTSMPELVFEHCGMLVEPAEKMWVPKGDFQSVPSISGFANSMIDAYDNLRERCNCGSGNCSGYPWRDTLAIYARPYVWDNVYREYWRPYLKKFAEERGYALPTTECSSGVEDEEAN